MKEVAFRYGIWMFLSLTGFFLLMHLLDMSENFYLRIFNGAIHLGLLWLALRAWTRDHHAGTSDVTSGVVVGMFTSFIGVVPFAFFMAIFLEFNPDLLASIKSQTQLGEYLNPVTSCFFIVVEAIAMSLIGSYIMVRILDAMREQA
ncbi:MAG: hypothetical protein ACKVT2_11720 [Saprospiraceae bacterium]